WIRKSLSTNAIQAKMAKSLRKKRGMVKAAITRAETFQAKWHSDSENIRCKPAHNAEYYFWLDIWRTCAPALHSSNNLVTPFSQTININKLIPRFWQPEEIFRTYVSSRDDKIRELMLKNSTIRIPNGRFQVNLPLISGKSSQLLGNSFYLAYKRFQTLANTLLRDYNLYKDHRSFIDEYVQLNRA
ncbi:hypothetical protein HHI36_012783, partial [Cryptolaemus montrouzieri]